MSSKITPEMMGRIKDWATRPVPEENIIRGEDMEEVATIEKTEVIKFDITSAAIDKMREEFLPLKITGLDDKKGYAACVAARKTVKGHRVAVEKRRKDLKEEALRYGQRIDSEAKKISSQLEEIEEHLQGQQDIIDKEAQRQAEKLAAEAKAKLDSRILRLQEVRAQFDIETIRTMADDNFALLIQMESARYQKELDEAAAKEAELLALREKEAAAQRERLAAEAEATRLRDELIAKQRAELAEKAKEAAAIKAKQEAELAEKQKEIDRKTQEAEAVRVAQARADSERLAAEALKIKQAEEAQKIAEAVAREKIADKALFDSIKAKFPTIESCWIEIARLTKEMIANEQ